MLESSNFVISKTSCDVFYFMLTSLAPFPVKKMLPHSLVWMTRVCLPVIHLNKNVVHEKWVSLASNSTHSAFPHDSMHFNIAQKCFIYFFCKWTIGKNGLRKQLTAKEGPLELNGERERKREPWGKKRGRERHAP